MSFLQHIQKRRSIYHFGNNLSQDVDQVDSLIRETVRLSPSSFNSQSSRVVTLYGASHRKFWQIVLETLAKIVPAEAFANTQTKIESFAAGFGTALFYEDQQVVKDLQEKFPLYADNFPVWSEHSTGIAQFAVWTALAEQNIGASLQHYNPIIDQQVADEFNLPSTWTLRAQLVFGSIETPAGDKDFMPDEQRFKRFD